MKKGITILALAIVVVIMSILAGVGIYFSEDIMKSVEKNEFSIELLNIQTILDTYYIENGTYPTLETLEINLDGFGTFELSQFDGENINDNIVTLWELDLNSLGIQGTALGRSEDDEDIYAVSLETGKVYYVRGVTYRGKTHYTLNADLSQSVKADIGVNGKRIKVKDVIFVLPKLKVVSEAVSVTVVLPKEAVLDNIVASNSVQIGNKTIYGDYQLIEVNKTNIKVNYEIETGGRIAVRIPAWSKHTVIKLNNVAVSPELKNGYAYITVADGDLLVFEFDDSPRFVYASSKVPRLTGMTALCRGPLVYCFEGCDNEGDVLSLSLIRKSSVAVSLFNETLLSGTVTLSVPALRREETDRLYSDTRPAEHTCTATAVPYYTWGNRGENQMRVWMNEL